MANNSEQHPRPQMLSPDNVTLAHRVAASQNWKPVFSMLQPRS